MISIESRISEENITIFDSKILYFKVKEIDTKIKVIKTRSNAIGLLMSPMPYNAINTETTIQSII